MPIKPENKKLYPKNWIEIRNRILDRAFHHCEICGIDNHAIGYRDKEGLFNEYSHHYAPDYYDDKKLFKIVLTIAHLDHDPTNNSFDNLKAMCQCCHNRYDAKHRQKNARKTRRARKAYKELF